MDHLLRACFLLAICVTCACCRSSKTVQEYEIAAAVDDADVDGDAATDVETPTAPAVVGREGEAGVTFKHHHYCKCHGHGCSCCHKITLWFITLYKACVHIEYENGHFVVRMKVYFVTVFKAVIPVSDHKPICGRYLGIHICVQLYNVKMEKNKIHACARLTKPTHLDLGCFDVDTKAGEAVMKMSQLDEEN